MPCATFAGCAVCLRALARHRTAIPFASIARTTSRSGERSTMRSSVAAVARATTTSPSSSRHRRRLLDISIVGSLDEDQRRAVGGELEPLPRPPRQGQFAASRDDTRRLRRVLLVGVHPPCREQAILHMVAARVTQLHLARCQPRTDSVYIKPLRSVSSEVRMRSTCCAVNMNMPDHRCSPCSSRTCRRSDRCCT